MAIWLEGGWRGAFSQGRDPNAPRTAMFQGEDPETPAPAPRSSSVARQLPAEGAQEDCWVSGLVAGLRRD